MKIEYSKFKFLVLKIKLILFLNIWASHKNIQRNPIHRTNPRSKDYPAGQHRDCSFRHRNRFSKNLYTIKLNPPALWKASGLSFILCLNNYLEITRSLQTYLFHQKYKYRLQLHINHQEQAYQYLVFFSKNMIQHS